MAEETPTEIVETPEQKQETPTVTVESLQSELDKVRKALKDANAESAGRRKRLEELEAAETKRKDEELSETEKLQAQLKDAQEKATRLEREANQRAAAEKIGLPLAFANRIQGETPEDMETDAKSLLEAMPKPTPKPPIIGATNPGSGAPQGETDEQRRRRLGI